MVFHLDATWLTLKSCVNHVDLLKWEKLRLLLWVRISLPCAKKWILPGKYTWFEHCVLRYGKHQWSHINMSGPSRFKLLNGWKMEVIHCYFDLGIPDAPSLDPMKLGNTSISLAICLHMTLEKKNGLLRSGPAALVTPKKLPKKDSQ